MGSKIVHGKGLELMSATQGLAFRESNPVIFPGLMGCTHVCEIDNLTNLKFNQFSQHRHRVAELTHFAEGKGHGQSTFAIIIINYKYLALFKVQ